MATVASWWLLEPAISGATSCTVFCCNRPRHLSGGHELFWRNEIFAGTGILVCYNRAQGLLPPATAALGDIFVRARRPMGPPTGTSPAVSKVGHFYLTRDVPGAIRGVG